MEPATGSSVRISNRWCEVLAASAGLPRCPAAPLPRLLPIYPLDLRTQGAQPLVDPFVTALDLAHVVDRTGAVGSERGQEHRHACSDIRGFDRATFQG